MAPDAQRQFVQTHMDADLQFILGEAGVSLEHQVAISRHYGNLRKFSALGDDRQSIRTACLQDFAIPADTPERRAQIASVVAAWETSKGCPPSEVRGKDVPFIPNGCVLVIGTSVSNDLWVTWKFSHLDISHAQPIWVRGFY